MEPESHELMRQYAAGDSVAAPAIYRRYAARLLAFARHLLSDRLTARVDAEDIVQSVYRSFFLRAREGRFQLRESGDLGRLLIAMTRHKTLHEVEKQTAAKRTAMRDVPADDWPTTSEHEQVVAVADELAVLLATLPDEQRQLLELRLQEVALEEIAAQLQISPRSLRRKMRELRQILERQLTEPAAARDVTRETEKSLRGIARVDYRQLQLQQLAGSGGFGKVYRAYWKLRQETVAVKVLRKQLLLDRRAMQRFLHEAQIIARLHHPGIVQLLALGSTPFGGYFTVLDWHGDDLARYATCDALELARWMQQAVCALRHAHEEGVIHCDIKPSNLLLSQKNEIVVTDFGFAWAKQRGGLTSASIGGTLGFAAPELWEAEEPTPACDVFSLGCVILKLLEPLTATPSAPRDERLRQLAEQCVARAPQERPAMYEVERRLGDITADT